MTFNIAQKVFTFNISRFPQVHELYLFGSVARGDNDEDSDIDFLVVTDDCTQDEYNELKRSIADELKVPPKWISLYEESKIRAMLVEGSLFLWHIKLEGKKLFSRNGHLEQELLTLPKYREAKRSLDDYAVIIQDIKNSIQNDVVFLDYEFSLLASLVRNISIIIDYNYGVYSFGRTSAIKECNKIIGEEFIPLSEYQWLYKYRSYHNSYSNGYSTSTDKKSRAIFWIKVVEDLLLIAERSLDNVH